MLHCWSWDTKLALPLCNSRGPCLSITKMQSTNYSYVEPSYKKTIILRTPGFQNVGFAWHKNRILLHFDGRCRVYWTDSWTKLSATTKSTSCGIRCCLVTTKTALRNPNRVFMKTYKTLIRLKHSSRRFDVFSFAAACSQLSLQYRWLPLSVRLFMWMCVVELFFKIDSLLTVIVWFSRNLAHMMCVPDCQYTQKTYGTDFKVLILKFWGNF